MALAAIAVAVLAAPVGPARAEAPLAGTRLLDIRHGSARTEIVAEAARGGYELAGGKAVAFADWYTPAYPDMHVEFITPTGRNTGLIWGFSTGESGEKYRVAPGLKLGFAASLPLSRNATLAFSAVAVLGSDLSERRCRADFGEIGGTASVNCRLAASALAPEETLRHRFRMRGWDDSRVALSYELRF